MFGGPAEMAWVVGHYVCLLFSLCFHEAAHAIVANRCGDPTARLLGRATLNPLAHIDPIGTVAMPLLMMFTGFPYLFGWAKPVPVNPRNLHNMRRDEVLVSAAGPLSNILLALTLLVVLKVVVLAASMSGQVGLLYILMKILSYMVMINFLLALFNLIPVPPLDGSRLLYPVLSPGGKHALEQIGPFGIIIAILVARHVLPVPMGLLAQFVNWFAFWGVN